MPFNVNDFVSEIGKQKGVMRNNKFLVTFAAPPVLQSYPINRTIEYWCDAVNLPGYQIMTHNVNRWTYGPTEKRPFAPNFTQLQLEFLTDNNGKVIEIFDDWMQRILPHDTDQGFNSTVNQRYPYHVEYKDQYATELNIVVYSEQGTPIRNVVCKEAFPVHMQDIALSWNDTNNVAKLVVVFDYLDWFIRPIRAEQ